MTEWSKFYVGYEGNGYEYLLVRVKPFQTEPPYVPHEKTCVVEFEIYGAAIGWFELENEGHIKWDGCANFDNAGDDCAHLCGPDGIDRIAQAFKVAYKLAAQLMPETCDFEIPNVEIKESKYTQEEHDSYAEFR